VLMPATRITCLLLVSTLLTLTGCEKIQQSVLRILLEPDAPDPIENVRVVSNIVYSQTPQGDLLLDLYLPAADSSTPIPVVLFFYGGAFEMGNKHQLGLYDTHTLPLDGFAVVSIDYRLSGKAIFPAQLEDARNALRWIHTHAGQYNLDVNNIGVWGMSAGGMLAALLGTGAEPKELVEDGQLTTPPVQAVVDYYGPSDFLQGDEHALEGVDSDWAAADSWASRYLGGAIGEHPDRVAATNPISYISADVSDKYPPFLIVHGDQDEIVPLHQSEILYAALQQAGVEAELYVVKDGGHARGGEFGSPELHHMTVEFLQQHLQ
jgi:acetyl esterase/lipase